jgi:hypothetical protein
MTSSWRPSSTEPTPLNLKQVREDAERRAILRALGSADRQHLGGRRSCSA